MSRFDLTKSIPILILSDGPDIGSGLARIAHDLAWLLCGMPEFQVGVLGRMAAGRAHYPWVTYSFPATAQWGEDHIQNAFEDLAQGRRGIILTVWDATRLLWFADPMGMPDRLQRFLGSGAVERWGLFMQDSEGVRPGHLPLTAAHVMSRFDRLLLASKWAYGVTKNTLPDHPDMDWLPHPLNTNTFSPKDRMASRSHWGISDKEVLIGCVMANQARKYWPVVFESMALMHGTTAGKPKIWCHTDTVAPIPGRGYWNLQALAYEYGIGDHAILDTNQLSDKEMAQRYSACDATVLLSGAEGFGYPIVESLACGVPCVTGQYGAGGELASHAVIPIGFRIETQHNARWAIYSAAQVAAGLEQAVDQVRSGDWEKEWGVEQVAHLNGAKIGKLYQKYFRKGLQ